MTIRVYAIMRLFKNRSHLILIFVSIKYEVVLFIGTHRLLFGELKLVDIRITIFITYKTALLDKRLIRMI